MRPSRLDANPGESLTTMQVLPIAAPAARAVATADSLVCSVRTSSTSFMMWAGLKKCIPSTRPGLGVASASLGTLSDGGRTYGKGTYVRHPPGSVHRPYSKDGCLIFVTLPRPIEEI